LHALGEFPQRARFCGEDAGAAFCGGGVASQAGLSRTALGKKGHKSAALLRDGGLCVSEDAPFGADISLALARRGDGDHPPLVFGAVGRGEGAGDDVGARRPWLGTALGESGGDDGGLDRKASVLGRSGVTGDLLLDLAQAFLRRGRGCLCLSAPAGGFNQALVERADFPASGVGLRAQPFGALGFSAAIALGLSGRALGLGVCRSQEKRERPSRTRDERAGAFCASCHFEPPP
jgi:hypothetical protein